MAGSPCRIMCQTKNKICFVSGLKLTQKIKDLTCLRKPPDPNLNEQRNLGKVVLCPPRATLIYYQCSPEDRNHVLSGQSSYDGTR